MKSYFSFSILIFLLTILFFFKPFFVNHKLPIPADTIIGLYHPYRDMYAKDYPNGIPYKNFLITDPVRQQYPWRMLAIEQEKLLQLPLWNPYNFSGTPLLATLQGAVFYPLNILFFFLPFALSWSLLIILQPILGGIFLYILLRSWGTYRLAGLLGGVTFALSGFSVAWMEWGTIGHVALWLPLTILSIDKLLLILQKIKINKKTTLFWSFIFLFSISSSFFAGHLQVFFYSSLLLLAYFISRWFVTGHVRKTFLFFALLIFAVLAITFVQWWPTMQFIGESARNIDQMGWHQEGWFIPWQHLIQFIVPDFFGNPTTLNYWGTWNYGELVGYVGILPLVMGLFALFYRRDKKTFFFGSIFFLSLIFSLPTIFAKLPFIWELPFLSSSQPTRLLFLTDFSLSILGALGIDWYFKQNNKKNILIPLSFLIVVMSGLWLYVTQSTGENIQIAKRNLYLPTLFLAIISIIIFINAFMKNKKIYFIFVGILLLVTIIDLLRFAQKFTPFTSDQYLFPSTKIMTFIKQDSEQFRIMATDPRILPPNFSAVYHIQSVDGYDPLFLRRYGELIAASERGAPDIRPPFGFNRIIKPTNINSPIINLLGVKYVLSFSELPSPQFTKLLEEGQTKVYKNNNTFPRVFMVGNIKVVKDKQEAIEALFDKNINLHNTAVVYNEVGYSSFAQGEAKISSYSENKIVIEVKNSSIGFLVLSDTFYPTWHAKVCSIEGKNCHETPIFITNYNLRGILVPSGNNRIEFYISLL